jgi:hypothetical protein
MWIGYQLPLPILCVMKMRQSAVGNFRLEGTEG